MKHWIMVTMSEVHGWLREGWKSVTQCPVFVDWSFSIALHAGGLKTSILVHVERELTYVVSDA